MMRVWILLLSAVDHFVNRAINSKPILLKKKRNLVVSVNFNRRAKHFIFLVLQAQKKAIFVLQLSSTECKTLLK